MILAVDFDGTIVEHKYPDIGNPVPGALETLKWLEAQGVRLILWTMRSGKELQDAVAYLKANGVELWAVNHNPEQGTWTSSPKAYAHAYVDDAAVGCPLRESMGTLRPCVDWYAIRDELKRRLL